jgi:hypothetical protein
MLALHREPGGALSSTNMVRKHLVYLEPAQPRAGAFDQGLYSQPWTARTYRSKLLSAFI